MPSDAFSRSYKSSCLSQTTRHQMDSIVLNRMTDLMLACVTLATGIAITTAAGAGRASANVNGRQLKNVLEDAWYLPRRHDCIDFEKCLLLI